VALTPEALQTLKKDFQNLMTQDNVHRFRMKRHVLEQIVGQLPKQLPDNLDWLKLEQGSILRLENYDWVGSSAWFPDESVE